MIGYCLSVCRRITLLLHASITQQQQQQQQQLSPVISIIIIDLGLSARCSLMPL